MDDLSQNQNIYQGEVSPAGEAAGTVYTEEVPIGPPEIPIEPSGLEGQPSPPEEVPPPPFIEENPLKKILPMVGGAIVALLVLFLLSRVFFHRGQTKPQEVTLTYWGLWEEEKVFAALISDFQKTHPKIKINYIKQNKIQYRERLQGRFQSAEAPPDIFRFHNTWLPMLKNDLAPVPQNILTNSDFEKTFYPVVKNDLSSGGVYFGIPLEIDGLSLFYNQDILKAASVSVPATWDELRDAAFKLTVKDSGGKIKTAGAALGTTGNIEHWPDILGLMFLQNGANPGKPFDEAAEGALAFYHFFSESPKNTWDQTLENSIVAFSSGRAAMIFAPSWEALTIKEINPNLNFKIAPVPQLAGGTTVTWASYWVEGVWQKSKVKAEAFEFLKFLTQRENMVKLYSEEAKLRLFGEPYSRVDLADQLKNDPYLSSYIIQAPTARSWYLCGTTADNGINDKIIKYYEDAVNSLSLGASPKAALETAGKGVSQVLSSYGISP